MARRVRISARYLSDCNQLGVRSGGAVARNVAREIRALAGADPEGLPLQGDRTGLVPHAGGDEGPIGQFSHARAVSGHHLWVWYRVTDEEVELVALTRSLRG